MDKVSIVIPAHNEEKRIGKTLENYISYFQNLKKNKKIDFEMIVVLNNCNDKTIDVVKKYKCKELKILNFIRGGKGFAIIEGFKEALKSESNLIGFVDADMATLPVSFYDLIKNINDVDGIIANRWDERSIINPKQSTIRKITSSGYNTIIRSMFMFPYRDTQCGAKIFKRNVLEKNIHKIISSEWNFDVALLFCLRKESGAKIKSLPTVWSDQKGSKINLRRTPIKMFLSAIRLRIIHSPFREFVRIYRRLPEGWKFH
jgi:glycosyltransferase involved in cell wall biosynthesis